MTNDASNQSGIFHVILRGNNKQRIFEDKEDFDKFLFLLGKYRKQCGFTLYAWCLMPNHIHILLKEGSEPLSLIFKRINSSFVRWYNEKYERVGHLFQGSYKAENVEDEAYFLKDIRYIHMNPVKGNLCKNAGSYTYSSYRSFFLSGRYADSDMIFGMIRKDEFEKYHNEKNEDICMDIEDWNVKKLKDGDAEEIVKKEIGCERIDQVPMLTYQQRNKAILLLLQAGASINQINRLTGISTRVIRNIRDKEKKNKPITNNQTSSEDHKSAADVDRMVNRNAMSM